MYISDKQETENIKEQIKDIEKRYIQIGGLLIGIVTFIFGSINFFTQQTATPNQMFQSTMGLGVILIIFGVVLVFIIENCKEKKNKLKLTVCGLILVIYTVILGFLAFGNNSINEDTKCVSKEQLITNPK